MTGEWKKIEKRVHDFNDNTEFIGVFKCSEEGQFEHCNFLFDVEGKDVIVYGKTALQTKLQNITPGTQVRIVCLGEKRSEKTGRTYQDFDVFTR